MQVAEAKRSARASGIFGALSALAFALSFPLSESFVSGWPLAFVWPTLFAAAVWSAPRPVVLTWTIGAPFFVAFLAHEWWMHHITELGMPVLVLYLTAWTVLLALLLRGLSVGKGGRTRWPFALSVPVALVAIEYLRGSLICSGYAWFFTAHPLVEWTSVAQVAALGGGWLLTALAGLVGGAAVDALIGPPRGRWIAPSVAALSLGAAFVLGSMRIAAVDGASSSEAPARLLVVQTNLPMSNKLAWPPEQQIEDFLVFARQTIDGAKAARERGGGIDLALWPETMLPGLGLEPESLRALVEGNYYPGDRYDEALRDLSTRIDAPLLVGSPAYVGLRVEGNRFAWEEQFNSAYLVGPDGMRGRTDKIYLTPFGEMMPIISNWDWLEAQLLALGAEGMTFDLDAAAKPTQFEIPSGGATLRVAVPICFEITQPWASRRIAFPDGARAADVVVNLSNDGWFGGSRSGRRQHLQVAQLRAIELGTPVVRCVNTGLSASIDSVGRVEQLLSGEAAGSFLATPTVGKDRPVSVVVGDWVAILASLVAVVGVVRSRRDAAAIVEVVSAVP
ncbi:MAG: Apolipoprotein N-acyltransferase [Planctomycetota bacterium]|jgi:apolipoprotein N-acyltransferase